VIAQPPNAHINASEDTCEHFTPRPQPRRTSDSPADSTRFILSLDKSNDHLPRLYKCSGSVMP